MIMLFYWISYQAITAANIKIHWTDKTNLNLLEACYLTLDSQVVTKTICEVKTSVQINLDTQFLHESIENDTDCIIEFRSARDTPFLISITNNLPVHMSTCFHDPNFILASENGKVNLGCIGNVLTLSTNPTILQWNPRKLKTILIQKGHDQIKGSMLLNVQITSVRFNCNMSDCFCCEDSHLLCISSSLRCDEINHCGSWQDEEKCPKKYTLITNSPDNSYGDQFENHPMRNNFLGATMVNPISSDDAIPTSETSTEGIAMILGFIIMTGLLGCCCCSFICYWRYRAWKSENQFVTYFSKYQTIQSDPRRKRTARASSSSGNPGTIGLCHPAANKFLPGLDKQPIAATVEQASLGGVVHKAQMRKRHSDGLRKQQMALLANDAVNKKLTPPIQRSTEPKKTAHNSEILAPVFV